MSDEPEPQVAPLETPAPPTAPIPAVAQDQPTEALDRPPAEAPVDPHVEAPAAEVQKPAAITTLRRLDRGPQAKPWRILTIVLLVLGCVLAPIGVTASWAKNLVTNQDAYLEAVGPLITDPAIVSAGEARLVDGIDTAITNLHLADKIGTELQSLGLPPKLASLATGYLATFRTDITDAITKMVDELLTSPKLATLWNNANAKAHSDFVQIMQGNSPGKLHTVNVDLSSAVTEVKQKLEASGVQWASQIPDVPIVFNIAENANVQRLAGYYDLLDTLGTWLPIVALLLLLVSILIAPSRLGGLSKAAGWLTFSMVVLSVLLLGARQWLVSKAKAQPAVTEAFTRQLTVNLQDTIRVIVIISAVVSLLAWMFGRSRSAVALRSGLRGLAGRVEDSRWQLALRIVAGVIALVLVIVLVTATLTFIWAILVALLAGLAAVIAAYPPHAPAAAVTGSEDADADVLQDAGIPA